MTLAQYRCHPITPNRRTRRAHAKYLNPDHNVTIRTVAALTFSKHLHDHHVRHALWLIKNIPQIPVKFSQRRVHAN